MQYIMKYYLKKLFSHFPGFVRKPIEFFIGKYYEYAGLRAWQQSGKTGAPPHSVKQKLISAYAKKYGTEILIETGTYLGDMVEAQRKNFSRIYSVELSHELWKKAVIRFSSFPHISILQGDSGKVLKDIMPKLNKPALFWLDGHYSEGITAKGDKETPVLEELETIFSSHFSHIVLIDDAWCFNGKGDYPSVDQLKNMILQKNPAYKFSVEDQIIRITPG